MIVPAGRAFGSGRGGMVSGGVGVRDGRESEPTGCPPVRGAGTAGVLAPVPRRAAPLESAVSRGARGAESAGAGSASAESTAGDADALVSAASRSDPLVVQAATLKARAMVYERIDSPVWAISSLRPWPVGTAEWRESRATTLETSQWRPANTRCARFRAAVAASNR